jgi:hypothetical protein
MKRDMGLIRALLLAVEASEGERVLPGDVPGYAAAAVAYHMRLAIEAGLARGSCSGEFCLLHALTWEGHELLDAVRATGTWHTVLRLAREAGVDLTLDTLKTLAARAAAQLLGDA